MAARTTVHIRLPNKNRYLMRTDLTGHGHVREGEEFTCRQLWPQGDKLFPGGKKLRVRVLSVERIRRSYHILDVEVLQDLTPASVKQESLF